tara:strand:+ start:4396 stop:5631 length:1236 start_codon:yes stop_codon:yes gene_type:complete
MRSTKNTFDLSLDIPLYGDINKLNFCNEYELKHYCFYEGDDGGGDVGAEDEAAAESFEAEDAAADAAAAVGMANTEYEIGRADAFADGATTSDPNAFIMTDIPPMATTRAAVPGDPEMDDEDDNAFAFGYVPGSMVGAVNTTPQGDEFGFHGTPSYEFGYNPDDMTAMEAVAQSMNPGMENSYIANAIAAFETSDPGSTNMGEQFLGYNTGYNRGSAANTVQAPPPGTFNPVGLIGLLGMAGLGPIGTAMGLLGSYEAGQVHGLPGLANNSIISSIIGNPAAEAVVAGWLDDEAREDAWGDTFTSHVGTGPTQGQKEGGLISLANGGVPEEPRVGYTRQNGGGIRDLVNDQTTLLDVINTGQAMPPNLGATQMQGAINPMQNNQQNAYTQSTQPQSFYAQPQQVKNYGKLY